ncbi:MAG: hypothetical protein GEU99_17630 [Luteitalea sp.]|nr:hypothetical protein [Luteitalea sp.]
MRRSTLVIALFLATAGLSAQHREGRYRLHLDQPRQTIWGLGVEIQSDSIGSANLGLPDKVVAVPHDLTRMERRRFYTDMLRGFRYCRLALGLYLRGLDTEKKHIIERYPGQMRDLKEMMDQSGMESVAAEYWSPAPYWKSNGRYRGGTLRSFDPEFLDELGDALVADLRYLEGHGLEVSMWSLQNEPPVNHDKYSTAEYSGDQYYRTMKAVAPKIRAAFPKVLIHADSHSGQHSDGGKRIRQDPDLLRLVDAWTWHRIGRDSNELIDKAEWFSREAEGKPVFNNEFEYLQGPASDRRFVNTAQSLMNWLVFQSSPTWFWLHALKPTYNAEASGYALGFWRPADDQDFSRWPDLKPGHWTYNTQNWHSLAGFLKYLPWDSVRLHVEEERVRQDNRILAWRTPTGRVALALTNRSGGPFRFHIDLGRDLNLSGFRYTPSEAHVALGMRSGATLAAEMPDLAIEFWVEAPNP